MKSAISFYEQFNCLADACPYNCCRGWRVPVDEETLQQYRKEPGIMGFLLSLGTVRHPVYGHLLRRTFGKCPYQNADHLCRFQCNGRDDLMPEICRLYPRLSVKTGEDQEVCLELSCYRAAQLFAAHPGRQSFHELSQEVPIFWQPENDDQEFLQFLQSDREAILDHLWQSTKADVPSSYSLSGLMQKMKEIYLYVFEENMHLLSQELEAAKTILLEEERADLSGYGVLSFSEQKVFYPTTMLNEILYQWFSGLPRNMENPLFYRYLKKYRRYFGKLYEHEADSFFETQTAVLLESHPEYAQLFYGYFSYSLQETYLLAYEDYYLLKPVMLSALFTQLLILFFVVDYLDCYGKKNADELLLSTKQEKTDDTSDRRKQEKKAVGPLNRRKHENAKLLTSRRTPKPLAEPAVLIMMVEKAFRHNETLEKLMLDKIRHLQESKTDK